MSQNNIDIYDNKADDLSASYDALQTPQVLGEFCKLMESRKDKPNLHALDIGCGSGRDAKWMAGQGMKVTAVDGSKNMLKNARKNHADKNIEYLHDLAPNFNKLAARGEKFDVILMSAFIFHFDKKDRQTIYDNLLKLAAENCLIYMTVRTPIKGEARDMYKVSAKEIKSFAKANGFDFIAYDKNTDQLKRKNVGWTSYALQK